MAGKSSLGLTFAGKISDASAIKPEDRTHAFDIYSTSLGPIRVTLIDLGGHKEYESCLAVLGRDAGLYVAVINPADIESEEKLYASLWSWVEKVLDGANQPNFLIVVTKADLAELNQNFYLCLQMPTKSSK